MRSFFFILQLVCLFFGTLGTVSCIPLSRYSLYPDRPLPAVIFDSASLEYFYEFNPVPAPAVRVRELEDGRVEPGGDIVSGDYFPNSFSQEIKTRLDLRSLPSLLALPSGNGMLTHSGRGWDNTFMDETSCAFASGLGSCTYKVVGAFDYTGNGRRDWLLVSSQQSFIEDAPLVILWFLVEDPQRENMLSVRPLVMEERYGIGRTTVFVGEEDVRFRLQELRKTLGTR